MSNIIEKKLYELSFRSIMEEETEKIKIFSEKDIIEIESEIEFDIEKSYKSSVNYFIFSIISGIMKSIINNGKKQKIEILEFESVIKVQLENPLTLLNVKGYDEEPKITSCNIKLYIYSNVEDDILINFCKNNLKKCLIYNTLKNSINFDIKFIPLI